eukprot:15090342-Alexandrium_andersonii.AAC.1
MAIVCIDVASRCPPGPPAAHSCPAPKMTASILKRRLSKVQASMNPPLEGNPAHIVLSSSL